MRALTYDGEQIRLAANHADAKPAVTEALIRPLRMGICGTDLEICRGYMGFKGVLGHEFVGRVEAVGTTEAKAWVGKRVVGRINCVCERCDMCRSGLRAHCRKRTVLGIAGCDGCFADTFILPLRNLIEVPQELDDDHAVFTEPLASVYQILRQLTIEGRPYITVLGDGRLGLLCAQIMSQLNATVRVVGKHPRKLALCEKWSVKHRLLEEVGLREDQDIVVDCTGIPDGINTAMQMIRPRGTIVMKTTVALGRGPDQTSGHQPIDLTPLVINEVNLIGSRCGPFPDALAALVEGKVDVLSLISRRMKLADGVDAIRTAQRPEMIKVLVEP